MMKTNYKISKTGVKIGFIVIGLATTIWFLIRVIPKPSRATYPCQRAAFPVASAFVIWLTGTFVSVFSFKIAKENFKTAKYGIAIILLMTSFITAGISWFVISEGNVNAITNYVNNSVPEITYLKSTIESNVSTPISKVSLVQSVKAKSSDLNESDIELLIRTAVYKTDEFKNLIKNNTTVVIKPNIVSIQAYTSPKVQVPAENNGMVTDWRIIKAVVKLVRELNPNGKVYVLEGSADYTTKSNMEYLKYTSDNIPGVTQFIYLDENSGNWEEWNSPLMSKVVVPKGKGVYPNSLKPNKTDEYYLNKIYYEADVLISVPVLKNHLWTSVTGSVKNVGIGSTPQNIYGGAKGDNHRYINNRVDHSSANNYSNLHKFIHDFYLCRPVDYTIMEGLQGTDYGPVAETTTLANAQKNMRLILAGKDAVAVDAIASLIMCYDPSMIEYLVLLHNDTAGCVDPKYIRVLGPDLNSIRKSFNHRSATGPKFTDTEAPKVTVNTIEFKNKAIHFSLTPEVANDIMKLEIAIDNQTLKQDIVAQFDNVNIDLSTVNISDSSIQIKVFDKYLNCNTLYFKGTKQVVGLQKQQAEYTFKVFPNPVTDKLHIVLNNPSKGTATMRVTDLSGKIYIMKQVKKNNDLFEYIVDCHHLIAGTYHLELICNSICSSQLFVKK